LKLFGFSCFSQSQPGIRCLRKTAVYDAVSQTLVNKHGDHCALLVSEKSNYSNRRSYSVLSAGCNALLS